MTHSSLQVAKPGDAIMTRHDQIMMAIESDLRNGIWICVERLGTRFIIGGGVAILESDVIINFSAI